MKLYAVIFDRATQSTHTTLSSSYDNSSLTSIDEMIKANRRTLDYIGFHNDFVKSKREILTWWHFMESLYIIGTDWSSNELSEHFRKTAEAHHIPLKHIVLEVNLQSRAGWLPKDAWDWIENVIRSPITGQTPSYLTSFVPPPPRPKRD
jgi:hypothetical protein